MTIARWPILASVFLLILVSASGEFSSQRSGLSIDLGGHIRRSKYPILEETQQTDNNAVQAQAQAFEALAKAQQQQQRERLRQRRQQERDRRRQEGGAGVGSNRWDPPISPPGAGHSGVQWGPQHQGPQWSGLPNQRNSGGGKNTYGRPSSSKSEYDGWIDDADRHRRWNARSSNDDDDRKLRWGSHFSNWYYGLGKMQPHPWDGGRRTSDQYRANQNNFAWQRSRDHSSGDDDYGRRWNQRRPRTSADDSSNDDHQTTPNWRTKSRNVWSHSKDDHSWWRKTERQRRWRRSADDDAHRRSRQWTRNGNDDDNNNGWNAYQSFSSDDDDTLRRRRRWGSSAWSGRNRDDDDYGLVTQWTARRNTFDPWQSRPPPPSWPSSTRNAYWSANNYRSQYGYDEWPPRNENDERHYMVNTDQDDGYGGSWQATEMWQDDGYPYGDGFQYENSGDDDDDNAWNRISTHRMAWNQDEDGVIAVWNLSDDGSSNSWYKGTSANGSGTNFNRTSADDGDDVIAAWNLSDDGPTNSWYNGQNSSSTDSNQTVSVDDGDDTGSPTSSATSTSVGTTLTATTPTDITTITSI